MFLQTLSSETLTQEQQNLAIKQNIAQAALQGPPAAQGTDEGDKVN